MKSIFSALLVMLATTVSLKAQTFNVNVEASGNSSALLEQIGYSHLSEVTDLTVSGTLNGYDFMAIRNKLPNLTKLDLSAVTILVNDYPYYGSSTLVEGEFPANMFNACCITDVITSVSLPSNITAIGESAFYGCNKLNSITFTAGVKEIKQSAFINCTSLVSVSLPSSLETIGVQSFQGCSGLKTINFPTMLMSIGNNAFANCTQLKNISFSGSLNSLGANSFINCKSIETLHLSNRISDIGANAFQNCEKMKELILPSSLDRLGSQAFSGCKSLQKIYAYAAQPISMSNNTFPSSIFDVCELFVPKTSYSAYYWDTQWSQFSHLIATDFEYENLYISNTGSDYQLDGTTGVFAGTPEIAVLPQAGIIIKDDIDQHASEVILMTDGTDAGSIIATNNLSVPTLTMQLDTKKNTWYFFALPYDALLADVRCIGNWVIRTYNGRTRADSGSGWVNLASNETTLKTGKGYIFQTDTDGKLYISMRNPVFASVDYNLSLSLYDASDVRDASWNFLGNPYPTYYSISEMDNTQPVTVFNPTTKNYIAYSPTDDAYHLAPFQPFFVQKGSSANSVRFTANNRRTYVMSQNHTNLSAPAYREADVERKIIDVLISGEDEKFASDRTRVVYNNEMSYGYDLGVDASKFLSREASVELYTCDATGKYAINERPQSGDVILGFRSAWAGTYTLKCSRADVSVVLYDSLTDTTCSLDEDSVYVFDTEAGSFNTRFFLSLASSAIESLQEDGPDTQCYDLSGRIVGEISQPGVYVEHGENIKKVIIR